METVSPLVPINAGSRQTPGTDSGKLSRRIKQPGHDQTFHTSEANLVEVAQSYLDPTRCRVEGKPLDLVYIFDNQSGDSVLGDLPEAVVESLATKRHFDPMYLIVHLSRLSWLAGSPLYCLLAFCRPTGTMGMNLQDQPQFPPSGTGQSRYG